MFKGASSFNQPLGTWNISSVTYMGGMLSDSGLSTTNYEATLIGWSLREELQNNVTLGADNLNYCSVQAQNARQKIINDFNWTIEGDANSCSKTAAKSTKKETTTLKNSLTSLKIFPNPATETISVQYDNNPLTSSYTLKVLDLSGKVLLEQNDANTIRVSSLKKGAYLLQTQNELERKTLQFIKE
jgi:surface protein